jgi:hypothetical protein
VQVSAHLITCVSCASEFEALTAEQEIYGRYDRAWNISPAMWNAIAARAETGNSPADSASGPRLRDRIVGLFAVPSLGWSFAGALTILLMVLAFGAYLRTHQPAATPNLVVKVNKDEANRPSPKPSSEEERAIHADNPAPPETNHDRVKGLAKAPRKSKSGPAANAGANQSDVLFADVAYSDAEEQETQKHLEQAQNLLRSVRNIEISEDDTEIDVSYEKTLSRQLLNENVVLRRDAEMSGKFPVKILLSSLEPFLLDIANLPDKASAEDLRAITERVQKTEIVAALYSY